MHTETSYECAFEKQRKANLAKTRGLFSAYMQPSLEPKEDLFLSFCKWPDEIKQDGAKFSLTEHKQLFLPSQVDQESGGYFLRLNQQGIAVNPGKDFFQELFQKGMTLFDIDLVVASKNDPDIAEAMLLLHELNRELNRTLISYEQEPHVVRFLLHPALHSASSAHFRPEFRHERNSWIALETFSGQESYQIDEELMLFYTKTENETLALKLESPTVSFGLALGGGWQEVLSHFFANCRIMLLAIGPTPPEDLEKVEYQKASLGYFGLLSLVQTVPSLELVLLSEFSQKEGDLRLELVKKLKSDQELVPSVIPIDKGFCLSLERLSVETINRTSAPYEELRILRANGQLLFIGSDDLL